MCKKQNICMHGVICFSLINFIMQYDYFQKINLFTPLQGSRIGVRAKYLLKCYCKLHSLQFDMQRDHILKKLILYLGGDIFGLRGNNLNKLGRGL